MAAFIIVAIIIVIIIILIFRYSKYDHFNVKIDSKLDSATKNVSEIYDLPCINCITLDNKLKPKFKYNISDSRCIYNNSNDI